MKQKLGYVLMIISVIILMSLALAKNESMGFSCPEKENEKSMYVCQFNNMVGPNEKCRCVYAPVYIKKWQCEDK